MAFFRDYWKPLLGFAIFLIVLTAGIQIYRGVERNTASDQMTAMMPLIAAPATVENAKALEDFAKDKAIGKRKSLALLYAAGKYQTVNKLDDMKRVLGEITNSSAPSEIKDYARVLEANIGNTDAAKQINKTSAWQPAVQELNALAENDPAKRRDIYAEIANDKTAPAPLRQRAAEFSGVTVE